MRVSELARATGVSAQTIHYYLREGLLLPPTKTAPNMAYYDPGYVDDIRLIKDLQQRFLPLSVIKLVLDAKRRGKDVGELHEMRLSLEDLFRPTAADEALAPMSLVELVAMTGLPAETLETLESIGLLAPDAGAHGKRYDGLDVRAARAAGKLIALGVPAAELGFYRQLVEALERETTVVGQRFVALAREGRPLSATDLRTTLEELRATLAARVYRRAAIGFASEEVTRDTSA